MIDKSVNILRTLVAEFFKEEWYHIGISNLRFAINNEPYYKENWENLIKSILLRQIPEGEALKILFEDGHQILHNNSEDEANKWFELMIINVYRNENESILDYQKFLKRNTNTSS